MDEPRSPLPSPEITSPQQWARALLAISFGIGGAAGTWFLGDIFPSDVEEALLIATATSGVIGASLGYFLGRRPKSRLSPWPTFIVSTVAAGAANGFICGAIAGASIGRKTDTYQTIPVFAICGSLLGVVVSAVCFLAPFAFVFQAYTRVHQARERSLLHRANLQRVCFATLAIVFAAASIAASAGKTSRDGHAVIAFLTLAGMIVFWAIDLARIARFFVDIARVSLSTEEATHRATQEIDLGIGTERWTLTSNPETAYRSRPRVLTSVIGSIESTRRALSSITIIDTLVTVSALAMCIYGQIESPSSGRRTAEIAPVHTNVAVADSSVERRSLSFYPQPGPIVTDINGDGVEDVIGLSWDSSHEDAAITVIAIDGASLQLRWTTKPVRSQWASPRIHLVRSGDRLFLTDSEGGLHIYETLHGNQILERENPVVDVGSNSLCAANEGDPRIWLLANKPGGGALHGVMVGADGIDTPADEPGWCHLETGDRSCNDKGNGTCITYDAPLSSGSHLIHGYGLEENDIGVGLGPLRDGVRGAQLVGYDKDSRAVRWEGSVAFGDDELHSDPQIHNELKFGRFYSLYQKKTGDWTLGARDARTGRPLWSRQPANTLRGTRFGSMTITETRLYLVVDWRLDVFDSKTGKPLGVIW